MLFACIVHVVMSAARVVPVSILVLAAGLAAGASVPRFEPRVPLPDVAMFDAMDVWDGDAGTSVTKAGFALGAAYRFDSVARRVALPMMKGTHVVWLWDLAASPTDERVAYCTRGADPPGVNVQMPATGVKVVASDSSQGGWYVDCWSPRWSKDGRYLAMIETRSGANGTREPAAVRVVDRAGRSVRHAFQPQQMDWGNGDTLFLEFEDRVEALDVARKESWPTAYAGCEVSDDGEYSFNYRGQFRTFRIGRRSGGVELANCVLTDLGVDVSEPRVMSPFWLRSATRGHLLCFSNVTVATGDTVRQANGQIAIMDPAKSPPGQRGVRTFVFDPKTFEVMLDLPGKVVAPTNDHRALVMLFGDSLSRVQLPEWPPEPVRPVLGKVRVQVYEWGEREIRSTRLVTDSTVTVAVGDWLPMFRPYGCRGRIRVAGMQADSLLELHVPAGMFEGYDNPTGGSDAARLLLGRWPVHLRTASYNVVLSRVR